MTTTEVLAYMAGLVDGEGSIGLNRAKGYPFRWPFMSISSTSYELLELPLKHFGGCICHHKRIKKKHSAAYSWRLAGTKALNLCRDLLPYLHEPEKRRRSFLLAHVYPSLTNRNGKYSKETIQAKVDFEHSFLSHSTKRKKLVDPAKS